VRAAFTKVVVTAGGSVLLTFGKETEITNASWNVCEEKKEIFAPQIMIKGYTYEIAF